MRKIFILFVLFICTSNLKAQSVYLDSLRNAVSFSLAYVTSENNTGSGISLSYTYKGVLNIGVARLSSDSENPFDNDDKFIGKGFSGFISFALLSELKGQNFGLELGLIKEKFKYESENFNEALESDLFGVGLNFSKRLTKFGSNVAFILQFSGTFFPIGESKFERRDNYTITSAENLVALVATPVFIFGKNPNLRISIEPSISQTRNEDASLISYGISSSLIF